MGRLATAVIVTAVTACASGDVVGSDPFGTGAPIGDDSGSTGGSPITTVATTRNDDGDPGASMEGPPPADDTTAGDDVQSDSSTTGGDCEPEICDGIDNDCDQQVDEGCTCIPGEAEPCYDGDPGTIGVGPCVGGMRSCAADGMAWEDCEGQVVPAAEQCNGIDDDCNTLVDEGIGSESCGLGACQVVLDESCIDGVPVPCVPGPAAPAEICINGEDDDCNGRVDDGCDCEEGQTYPCYGGPPGTANVGVCVQGTQSCENNVLGNCVGAVLPSPEACNDLDDDCDGNIDENNPGGGGACNTGSPGPCANGANECQDGAIVCTALVDPVSESCNGVDDDCDGMTDEGNPGGGASCNTGNPGVCGAGTMTCLLGVLGCQQNVAPSGEACDGLDNDCDGLIDELNPGGGQSCSTGNQGVCGPGTTSCSGGSLQCVPNQGVGAETCDGLDNDCDGLVDEGNPGGGGACNTGLSGVCAPGTMQCAGGVLQCQANVGSTTEVCDGVDNDCDGMTDEGNPGGGQSCNTGNLGVCAAGTTSCTSGSVVCVQNQQPSTEVCDAFDNNCNGQVNEGNPGGGVACNTGQAGVCSAGTTACQNNAIVCNQNQQASPEVCDALDNNCNGQVNEGNPGGGVACTTGLLGVCSAGTTACQNNAIVCNQNQQPSPEVCDAFDNNCNGQVNEGNPGGGGACNTGQPGVCAAGTLNCVGSSLQCTQNQGPTNEICGNGLDDNCNGSVDEGCAMGCIGYCGVQSPQGCWCDAACVGLGDCCSNACTVCGQCGCGPANCGSASSVPGSNPACFCDAACVSFNDCCSNVCAVCGIGC